MALARLLVRHRIRSLLNHARYDGFNNYGEHEVYKGAVEGDTWTWTGNSDFGGNTVKGRFVVKVVSPTSYTFRFDFSPDGSSWTNVLEGKATKSE